MWETELLCSLGVSVQLRIEGEHFSEKKSGSMMCNSCGVMRTIGSNERSISNLRCMDSHRPLSIDIKPTIFTMQILHYLS